MRSNFAENIGLNLRHKILWSSLIQKIFLQYKLSFKIKQLPIIYFPCRLFQDSNMNNCNNDCVNMPNKIISFVNLTNTPTQSIHLSPKPEFFLIFGCNHENKVYFLVISFVVGTLRTYKKLYLLVVIHFYCHFHQYTPSLAVRLLLFCDRETSS